MSSNYNFPPWIMALLLGQFFFSKHSSSLDSTVNTPNTSLAISLHQVFLHSSVLGLRGLLVETCFMFYTGWKPKNQKDSCPCFCYYFFAVTPPQTRILKLNMGVWTQMMSKLQTADLQVRQKKCSGLVIISIGSTNEFHLISRISPIKDDIARVVVWVKSKLGNLRGRSKPGRVRLKKPGNKGFLK